MQSDLHCDDQKFYSLEKHFKKACSRHPQLKFLKAQWRFDQELIGKALQNVGTIFPHYSRHDASHSRQIIVNIERILGDKIKFLSATDTWLILEAAYNHDIGMVITGKQIEDLNTKEFNEFLKSISEDQNNPLQKFAKDWITDKGILPQDAKAHEFFHQYIQLLSEWYRPRHPEQSAATVRNPVEEIGLNSPRNELLPKRLFDILGLICKAHGDSFQAVLNLPKAEAGMANEDCHPLYVACLLRMGDLLDVDDNRFCPVMLAMCGKNLPAISKAHNEKHHSIKHLRLDSERIEIKCVCPTPEAYETAYDWFSWLQTEYHEQTQHWDKIVPCKELGRLPTLMTPDVDIDHPFLILEKGKRPDFKVNKETVLDLVRGTGLYASKYDAIREILQNAVDSTIHRIWIEKGAEIENKLDPSKKELYEIYDQYKIDVTFTPKDNCPDTYILKVKDQGTGICYEDLKYMMEIGSSFKNKAKKDREDTMPMWFKPSGAFGIGLQSAYLMADKFTILTHSKIDNQKLKLQFSKTKNNNVIIEKITDDIKIGSEFIMEIQVDDDYDGDEIKTFNQLRRNRISHFFEEEEEEENDFINLNLKPNPNPKPNPKVILIKHILNNFFEESFIQSNQITNPTRKTDDFIKKIYWCDQEEILLKNIKFGYYNVHLIAKMPKIEVCFRGQAIEFDLSNFNGIEFIADFYHEISNEFLTYNRKNILPKVQKNAHDALYRSLIDYIHQHFNCFSEQEKQFAALFYQFSQIDKPPHAIQDSIKKAFHSFPILINNKDKPIAFHDLIKRIKEKKIKILSILPNRSFVINHDKIYNMIEGLIIQNNNYYFKLFNQIKHIITENELYYEEDSYHINKKNGNLTVDKIIISDDDIQPLCNRRFKRIFLAKRNKNDMLFFDNTCRKFFPAWGAFRKLSIKEIVLDKHVTLGNIYQYTSCRSDYLLLPMNYKYDIDDEHFFDHSDQFIQWVYNNRKNQDVTIEEVKILNKQLIDHIKEILRTTPDEEDESNDE